MAQVVLLHQVPAGLIDEGEDAAQAAVRELKEETGAQFTYNVFISNFVVGFNH